MPLLSRDLLQMMGRLLLLVAALLPESLHGPRKSILRFEPRMAAGRTLYSGEISTFLSPSDPDLPFITARIASADQQIGASSTGSGWSHQPFIFYSSLANLILASSSSRSRFCSTKACQPSSGYSMNLNLGDLSTSGLAPPTVHSPAFDEQINTLTPTFLYTLPTPGSYHADLYHFEASTGVFDTRVTLLPGSSSLTPSLTLVPNREYYLDIYNFDVHIPGLGFSTPIDADDNQLANWRSRGDGIAETIVKFTAVPEPSSLCILALASVALVAFRRHQR